MFRLISGPREGWLSLLLLTVVVLSPAISLADADWVDGLWVVPWLAFFSVLLGTVLAKLPVRGLVAHLFAWEIGLVLVGTHFAASAPRGDWEGRFLWLGGRIWAWLEVAFGGGMSNDSLLFTLLMALAAWLLGYLSAWFTFRRHNVWLPLIGCGSALLVNLSYGAPDPLLHFVVLLLASMLLLIRITLFQKERDWASVDAEYNRSLARRSLWGSGALAAALLAFAWALPIGSVNAAVAENWYRVTGPWQGLQVEFDRLFASIGTSASKVEGNRFTKTLALKGAIELGPEPVMVVSSPLPEYWAAQAYDRYTGQGWMSSAAQTTRLEANDSKLAATNLYRGRWDIEQRFKLVAGRSSSVFAATSPVRLSLPVYSDHFDSLEELAALRSTIPMRPGQQYAVISSVSMAAADQLRKAGKDYPEWTRRYLELPTASTRRVATLARRMARDVDNPYDAALALQEYLRRFRYEIKVAPPPTDRDAVDWFLFTSKEGYCDYFASAMAVMARSLGIPARVVSGYNTGTLNERTGLYEVRQENAHSWPELFFPNYGWVRFEPTPSQPVPERPQTALTESEPLVEEMTEGDLQALDLEITNRDRLLYSDDFDLGGSGWTTNAEEGAGDEAISTSRSGVPFVLLAALLGLAVAWRLALSRLSPTGRAYLQMSWVAGLVGWRLRPSYTPAEYARLLGSASSGLEPEVESVARSYAEEIYGGRHPADEGVVERLWRRIRWRLALDLLRSKLSR